MNEWKPGAITCKVAGKDGPINHIVAGWVNGPLGTDFRVFADDEGDYVNGGFVLTHLHTGMVVRQLVGVGTKRAKELANYIADAADWSFIDEPSESHRDAIKNLMGKFPGEIDRGIALIGPAL